MYLIIYMDDPSDQVILTDNLRNIYDAVRGKSHGRVKPVGVSVRLGSEESIPCTNIVMKNDLEAGRTDLELYDPFDDETPFRTVDLTDVRQIRVYFP